MRIAIAYDSETAQVFSHFGECKAFKLVDVADNQVIKELVLHNDMLGHEAVASFLTAAKVDMVICGGIGAEAIKALSALGIKVFPGLSGKADDMVKAFLSGSLTPGCGSTCSHHCDGQSCEHCGEHGSEHGCGC